MGFAVKKGLAKLFITDRISHKPSTHAPAAMLFGQGDSELMAAYQNGNIQAFQILLSRHQKPVFGFLRRMLGNVEEAEEAFQEVFLKVIRARFEYRPALKFTTWLYTLARHQGIDQLRRRARRSEVPIVRVRAGEGADDTGADGDIPGETPDTGTMVDARKIRECLDILLAELGAEQKEVFLLREGQGLPFDDIARVTGVPVNTVKSRMRYALNFLRRGLSGMGIIQGAHDAQ